MDDPRRGKARRCSRREGLSIRASTAIRQPTRRTVIRVAIRPFPLPPKPLVCYVGRVTEIATLTCAPTSDPRRVRTPDGRLLDIPAGWTLLLPGDAGVTRRVKAAGPSWTMVEKVGRKTFSRGVWAPDTHVAAARIALAAERSTDGYAKKQAAAARRRESAQATYVTDFASEVRTFLRFSPNWATLGETLATAVTAHATPVGSGTVARTQRIEIDRRAEAAVIAWLRHQTTAYDSMTVPRVKGARREVRRELADVSRRLLDRHRRDEAHAREACALCRALVPMTSSSRTS